MMTRMAILDVARAVGLYVTLLSAWAMLYTALFSPSTSLSLGLYAANFGLCVALFLDAIRWGVLGWVGRLSQRRSERKRIKLVLAIDLFLATAMLTGSTLGLASVSDSLTVVGMIQALSACPRAVAISVSGWARQAVLEPPSSANGGTESGGKKARATLGETLVLAFRIFATGAPRSLAWVCLMELVKGFVVPAQSELLSQMTSEAARVSRYNSTGPPDQPDASESWDTLILLISLFVATTLFDILTDLVLIYNVATMISWSLLNLQEVLVRVVHKTYAC